MRGETLGRGLLSPTMLTPSSRTKLWGPSYGPSLSLHWKWSAAAWGELRRQGSFALTPVLRIVRDKRS